MFLQQEILCFRTQAILPLFMQTLPDSETVRRHYTLIEWMFGKSEHESDFARRALSPHEFS